MCDRSNRGDLVDMTLYNPDGFPVAYMNGKFTSYDSCCYMSPSNGDRMDMTTVRIDNETKMAVTQTEAFYQAIREYRITCGCYNGRPDYQQKCDTMYDQLQVEAERLGLRDRLPQRIVIGNDPVDGVGKAFA